MKFGIFDHVDRQDIPLAQTYEERLRLLERADTMGFHCYHVAEHHMTPLGMAPSPSVYLAAVTQRTRRMRLGPLVYLQRPEQFTLALGLQNFQSQLGGTPWHQLMAASVLDLPLPAAPTTSTSPRSRSAR